MLKISALSAAVLAAVSFHTSATQEIEHITVTANKFEQPIKNTLASVSVLERDQIDQLNVRDIPSLLNTLPGVDVVRSGGLGQIASVFVRGASIQHTLVLIDGVRVSDANSGNVSFTNIPVNSIERIEVVRGARAAIYGSDAVSGVINIITREAQTHEVTLTSGSHNYVEVQAAGRLKVEKLSLGYNFGIEQTDGYDVIEKDPSAPIGKDHDQDGYENKNFGFNLAYDFEQYGELSAITQFSEGTGEYDNPWGNDEYDFENYTAKLAWVKRTDALTQNAALNASQEENVHTGSEKEDIYSTERRELEYQARFKVLETLQATAGISHLNEDVSKSTAKFTESQRDNTAIFAGAFYDDEKFLANLSVRSDDYDFHGRANTYTTGFGVKAHKNATFRINHGTSFRAPTLSNAFVADSPWYAPNGEIKPEEAENNEIGLTLTSSWGRYDVAVFENRITNLISNIQDPETKLFVAQNINKATMKGVELSAQFEALGFEHSANLTLLDAKDNSTGTSTDLPRRPSKAFNYTLTKQWEKLNVNLTMLYRSDRPTIAFYNSKLSAYTVFNLSANYELLDGIELNARMENLTDKEYFTSGAGFTADGSRLLGYKPLGRQLYVGAKIEF
ncbi:TonB-dependent receptor [Pseudoalteromonas luteoviolacea]|uniref:TonB-dependent receptor domain-containing protein n=1 Tax=Pseudoalteromonas luteoviolacea TaxID=43657 RepID=UPI001B3A7863|nr:TonB-dependent receptor [Pseudoalteromonas luteoviolacea]MBQ4876749.1 TonB-dependent receptor [Pseudoalteromonas luteoviolacea]MBQ4905462.1 TonB-dependent receptor [Pseudoalteromonas luteoviolacea]